MTHTPKHTMNRRTLCKTGLAGWLAAGTTLAAAPSAVRADKWPDGPIKFVVGYAPSGTSDVSARVVGEAVSEKLGVQVLVENRPGAQGRIAADLVARSKPDGQTFLVSSAESLFQQAYEAKQPIKAGNPLVPISILTIQSLVVAAHPDDEVLGCGATLAKAPGGGVGTASLATATAPALGAKLLSDAAASAAATLDDKIATNVGDLATLSGTFATLLKVPTMGLDKDSGGELVSKTSNDWQTAKTALVTANQAKAATDTAVTTADAAVKAAGGDAKATPAQIKARDDALVAQGLANDNKDEKVTAEDDAATAFSNAVEA